MTPKEISRKSKRIFESALPPNWAFRPQEDQEDYGVDGEIEITDHDDHATGFIFKVQLKGKNNVSIVNNGTKASCIISTKHLNYYVNKIEIPVVLILVDISTKKIYWHCLQLDSGMREKIDLALAKGQNTITVRLETNNIIPDKIKELLINVDKNMNWLRQNAISRMSFYVSNIESIPSISKNIDATKLLQLHLYNDKFEKLFIAKKYEELYNEALLVMNSKTEKIETRFCACLYIDKIYNKTIDRNSYDCFKIFERLYLDLLEITRKKETPRHIKLFVIFLIRNNRLYELVRKDFQFYITDIHTKGNAFLEGIINIPRTEVAFKTAKEIEKIIILIEKIHKCKFYNILSDILVKFLPHIISFSRRLESDNLVNESKSLNNSVEFLTNLGINIALSIKHYEAIKAFIIYNIISDSSEKAIEDAKKLISKIEDVNIKEETLKQINEIKKAKNKKTLLPDEEIEIFKERAITHGININDPNDEIGQIIVQGLKDYNPERVLRNCKYLLITPDALGMPAQLIGLTSAGSKRIYCQKTKEMICGWDLDSIYSMFQSTNCKNCAHKKPRPSEWKWNSQWQNETLKKMGNDI